MVGEDTLQLGFEAAEGEIMPRCSGFLRNFEVVEDR